MKNNILRNVTALGMMSFAFMIGNVYAAPPAQVPPPPQDSLNSNDGNISLPQIANPKQQNISESAAAKRSESDPTKFKVITEQRGPGGAVNQVNVDNPDGGLPDYYLTPKNGVAPASSRNINPNTMSTPQWDVLHW